MSQSARSSTTEPVSLSDANKLLEVGREFLQENASLEYVENELDETERVDSGKDSWVRYDDDIPVRFYSGDEESIEILYSKATIVVENYEMLEEFAG